jgi:hypothetical protein
MDFIYHLLIKYLVLELMVLIWFLLIILRDKRMVVIMMNNYKISFINLLIRINLFNIFFPFLEINVINYQKL